jgi:hypothetical protein
MAGLVHACPGHLLPHWFHQGWPEQDALGVDGRSDMYPVGCRKPVRNAALTKQSAAAATAFGDLMEHVREAIHDLKPANRDQQWLADDALRIATSLLRERWLLIERAGPSVHPVMIVILVSWVVAIFVSFGMNAPRHANHTRCISRPVARHR